MYYFVFGILIFLWILWNYIFWYRFIFLFGIFESLNGFGEDLIFIYVFIFFIRFFLFWVIIFICFFVVFKRRFLSSVGCFSYKNGFVFFEYESFISFFVSLIFWLISLIKMFFFFFNLIEYLIRFFVRSFSFLLVNLVFFF